MLGYTITDSEQIVSHLVYAVLGLLSWNCYPGEQGLTAQNFLSMITPNDFIE